MFESQGAGLTSTEPATSSATRSTSCSHQTRCDCRQTVIADLKRTGELGRNCRCRPAPYLNNIIEQDHRFIKKRIAASLWFRSVDGALSTIEGYEAMHMIRKGQIRCCLKETPSGKFDS
jgi:transposase-like protein